MPLLKRRPRTLGLALSGGSTLGIAHIGVLKAFTEEGIEINAISGTSAGSLVAACHAFGVSPDRMAEVTKTLDWRKLSRFAYSRLGMRSNKPMEDFIVSLIGDKDLDDAPIPLSVIATDIEKREKVVLRHSRVADAVRASACIPGYFVPVEVNGRLLVDGWLVENLPLSPLLEDGVDVVVGVNLTTNPPLEPPRHLMDIVGISFSMLAHGRDRHALDDADVLIEPELSRFDSSKFFDVDLILEEGYRAAHEALPAIRAALAGKRTHRQPASNGLARVLRTLLGRPHPTHHRRAVPRKRSASR